MVGRVVGPVNIGVAVQAGAGLRNTPEARCVACSQAIRIGTAQTRNGALMRTGLMALLAQEGRTDLEQVVDRRPMRVVADGAVLSRLVLADERTAFFHVTSKARVGDAIALHQLGAGRAMRSVAIRADNLAFQNGMMRWLVGQYTLLLVAGEADFGLGALVTYLVVSRMKLVTRSAGYVSCGMRAAGPVNELAAFVTTGADLVVPLDISGRLFAERESGPWPLLLAVRLVDVRLAFTVTTDTAGQATVDTGTVASLPNTKNRVAFVLIVAARALGIALENNVFLRIALWISGLRHLAE